MSTRSLLLKPNEDIRRCPKCNNNTQFTIHSEQVAEDYCNIWAVCICGYDPSESNTNYRVEDVWGGVDDANSFDALYNCWNEAIEDQILEAAKNIPLDI